MAPLLPDDLPVPEPYADERFRLEPLGQRHNHEDHQAWTSSIDHIQRTPGFVGRKWPSAVESEERNLVSLRQHEEDYRARRGFAYAVLDAESTEYLGCVYFYPPRTPDYDVDVRSWVRSEKASLDKPLHDAVRAWLRLVWPWTRPDYAAR